MEYGYNVMVDDLPALPNLTFFASTLSICPSPPACRQVPALRFAGCTGQARTGQRVTVLKQPVTVKFV
jgi:hypothetical protein